MIILSETTTIQLPQKLKKDLDSLKDYGRQTYAEVICRLVNSAKEDEEARLELSEDTLKSIKEAREDVRKGRVFSSKQIRKELGL